VAPCEKAKAFSMSPGNIISADDYRFRVTRVWDTGSCLSGGGMIWAAARSLPIGFDEEKLKNEREIQTHVRSGPS